MLYRKIVYFKCLIPGKASILRQSGREREGFVYGHILSRGSGNKTWIRKNSRWIKGDANKKGMTQVLGKKGKTLLLSMLYEPYVCLRDLF